MRGPNQTGFIGYVADGQEIERHLIGFQDHGRATDADLAHPGGAEAAAHDNPFGIAPGLELEKAADDEGQLLREVLDCALHDAGSLWVALGEQRIEFLPADVLAGLVAERIAAGLAQRFAPALENGTERALVGAVAEQAFVVLQFDVVAVHLDLGEGGGAVRRNARRSRALIGHEPFPWQVHNNRQATEKFQRLGQTGEVAATIRRTISIAHRISVSDASSVRKAAWEVSVTLSMRASG